ncbi:MAG: CrcB family protein, partial [Microbacterium sp.]
LLGLVTGLASSGLLGLPWLAVLGAGVLGGYTTFSTAMVDSIRLVHERDRGRALVNAFGMLAATLLAAAGGLLLGLAV